MQPKIDANEREKPYPVQKYVPQKLTISSSKSNLREGPKYGGELPVGWACPLNAIWIIIQEHRDKFKLKRKTKQFPCNNVHMFESSYFRITWLNVHINAEKNMKQIILHKLADQDKDNTQI